MKIETNSILSDEQTNEAIAPNRGYNQLHVVLFSGGRTSAFLAKYIKENPKYPNTIFVFMNTGKEREETLQFVDNCDKEFGLNVIWLEAVINSGSGNGTTHKIVNFETASRNGEPFTEMLGKYYLPNNRAGMNCTRELKQRPIDSFLRENGKLYFFPKWLLQKGYSKSEINNLMLDPIVKKTTLFRMFSEDINVKIIRVVGIRHDERYRMSVNAETENIIYPLVSEIPVDAKFIRNWWSRQSFDLKLKDYQGNCDLCFKKSLKKRLTIISENPSVADWWKNAEETYGSEESPRFDMRTNLTVSEQIQMAKRPFSKAVDLADSIHPELFEFETDCFCKAT